MSNFKRDTGKARLPALQEVRTGDAALDRWVQAVTERLEVREGARGNQGEQVVLKRDLDALALRLSSEQKAVAKDLVQSGKLDLRGDYTRFDNLPEEIRAILLTSIADEAAKRGADIRYLEQKIQSETESLAYKVEEVTAAVEGSAAGVRELTFAYADADRAQAGKITQLEASLGNYYQDGTPGRASLEQTMLVTADRVDGLAAEYSVKLTAGGAIAGFGLAASEDPDGNTFSEFKVQADSFKIVPAYDYVQASAPTGASTGAIWLNILDKVTYRYNGTAWVVYTPVAPFAVDTTTGTTLINGQLRLAAGGGGTTTLDQAIQSVKITADATVFKVNASGVADRASINLTATLNNGLTGTVTWSALGATLTGSGNTRSLAYSSMSQDAVTVQVQVQDSFGKVVNDYLTIYRARDGANGTNGVNGTNGADGAPGAPGAPGVRGIANVTRPSSAYSADSVGSYELTSALPDATPRIGDAVTLYNTAQRWSKTWVYNGSWSPVTLFVDGNAVITGTLSAGTVATSKAVISPSAFFSTDGWLISGGKSDITLSIPGGIGTPLYTLGCTMPTGVLISHVLSNATPTSVTITIAAFDMTTGAPWSGSLGNLRVAVF